MKLHRVEVENFRVISRADLDLTHPVLGTPLSTVLLVGPNGSGKSSVLDAIVGVFSGVNRAYGGRLLREGDIRRDASDSRVRVLWEDGAEFSVPLLEAVARITEEVPHVRVTPEPDQGRLAQWRKAADAIPSPIGSIAFFDAERRLDGTRVGGPGRSLGLGGLRRGALHPTGGNQPLGLGSSSPRFDTLPQWIINLDYQRLRAHGQSPAWESLTEALNTFFAPYVFEGVDEDFNVLFRAPSGSVTLDELSAGFKTLFVILTELLFRLSLTTDDPNQILQQEAVCLIDEIDLHLHPRWQETVIPGLRAMFPRVQFIATTHSPIVVSTVEPHEVFVLGEE